MRIAIVGSGALGLYYGAKLAKAGNDVRFLLRRDYEVIRSQGLRVYSSEGDFHLAQVKGYLTPEEMGMADLVVIGLKTFANSSFSSLITPLLGPDTSILTLQNGLGNEEELAALFGAGRVLGGVAYLASNRTEPGVIRNMSEARILLGEHSQRRLTERAEAVAAMFRSAGVRCQAVDDLVRARWEKLIWNIPFNGLCALMQRPVDALLSHEPCCRLVLDIMAEVIEAANSQGPAVPIDPDRGPEMVRFTRGLGSYKPSMQIDRAEGRPLELKAIFEIPLKRAAERGVAMPKTEELCALLDFGEPGVK